MRDAVEAFLFHEARLLDSQAYDAWLDLFTDDATYWIPIEHDQENPHETISLIYDDRRALETRVRQLGNPNRHAQSPRSRTNHLIGNVTVEGEDGTDALTARCNLQMVESRGDRQRLFAGECVYTLIQDGESFKIRSKRVNLINCDAAHDGINVPI